MDQTLGKKVKNPSSLGNGFQKMIDNNTNHNFRASTMNISHGYTGTCLFFIHTKADLIWIEKPQ